MSVSLGPVVLGIDPGFASLGWAAVRLASSGPELLALGLVRTKKDPAARLASGDNLRRARELCRALVVDTPRLLGIRAFAVEAPSGMQNAGAATKVGIAWGVVATLAEQWDVPVAAMSPQALKKALTGKNDASKDDVLDALHNRPGFGNLYELLKAAAPRSLWEHPVDAAAAVVAALDTDIIRAVRRAVG